MNVARAIVARAAPGAGEQVLFVVLPLCATPARAAPMPTPEAGPPLHAGGIRPLGPPSPPYDYYFYFLYMRAGL